MSNVQVDSDHTVYTVSFEDNVATDTSITGGKGANLAWLVDAEFTVPPGFCVTTAVYRTLVTDSETKRVIESLETLDPTAVDRIAERSATVRERIANTEFPSPVRQTIEETLEEIEADTFAVRSSATAEDLPTASFAGQHETFLGVNGQDAIIDRIRDCMASLFTERAVSYRLQNGVSHTDVAMAVVVQAMVDPEAAGVLFTADPVSGNRHVASVDANYGLGDTVVAGEISPDNARVDRTTGEVLDYEIGDKSHALRRQADTNGTETVAITKEQQEARVLSDTNLRALVDLGERVEESFGNPQDIEWALVDGDFILLQARPITSLFPLPSILNDDHFHICFSMGHQQAMPEALPPLVVDWLQEMMNDAVSRFQPQDTDEPFAVEAGHRVYADLTPLLRYGLTRQAVFRVLGSMNDPAARKLEELLEEHRESISQDSSIERLQTLGRVSRRIVPFVVSAAPTLITRFIRPFIHGPPDSEHVRGHVETNGKQMAQSITQPASQSEQVRVALNEVDPRTLVAQIASQSMPPFMAGIVAGNVLERLYPDAEDELNALSKGFDDEIATQINQRLGDIADVARQHPAVVDAIEEEATISKIEQVDGGTDFVAAFDAFLDDFGFRASSELDLSRPRWKDNPAELLQTIRNTLAGGDVGDHREHLEQLKADAEDAVATLETRAGRGILGPVKKPVVQRLIQVYRGGIQFREYHKHGAARSFAAVHDVFAEAGESLAAADQLTQPDDVWYLRTDELLTALASEAPLNVDIDERRRMHDRYASMTAPPLLTSNGEPSMRAAESDSSENVLVGTPVSSGVVEGPARVIRDPAEESLEKGEILVAPSTDVGWTPLFQNATGLVMEVGGRMTHGALVAREYGIPAVVSVSNVTTDVQTGERIRIDGSRGTVERLDRSETSDAAEHSGISADGT